MTIRSRWRHWVTLVTVALVSSFPYAKGQSAEEIRSTLFAEEAETHQQWSVGTPLAVPALLAATIHVAPPTGTHEADRASIVAALEQVQPGGTVQFAAGTYLVGEIIEVAVRRVTVLGHPNGTTLRGCDPVAWQQMTAAAAEAQVGAARWNVRARCGTLRLTGGHVTVRNLTFEDTVWGLVLGWMDPTLTSEGGHHIEGNTFRNSGNGIRVGNQSSGPTIIRRNRFINTYHALGGHGGHLHFLENDISVPKPERVPDPGYPGNAIALCGEHNVIAGNRIAGHPEGISLGWGWEVVDACRHNVIRDNTIIVQRTRALRPPPGFRLLDQSDSTLLGTPLILGHPSGEGAFEDNLIEGNHIVGAEGIGIEVRNASRNLIVNNTITGVVRRQPFPGNWNSEPDQVWREANGSGIWLSPGSNENEIAGNVFEDIAGDAIVLEGDRNRVETRSTSDGIRDEGSGNLILMASSINGAGAREGRGSAVSADADRASASLAALEVASHDWWLRGDLGRLDRLMMDEFHFIAMNGALEDKQEIVHGAGQPGDLAPRALQVQSLSVEPEEVVLRDNEAIVVSLMHIRATVRGRPIPERMRVMSVFLREGDEWRLFARSITPILAPPGPPE
jgi:parallel beta-helix repeat protein